MRHGLVPPGDRVEIGERAGEMLGQQPRAVRRDGPVDRGEQAPGPLPRQSAGEFEVGARRRVDGQGGTAVLSGRDRQRRACRELRAGDVQEHRSGSRDLGPGELTEAFQRRDAVLLTDAPLGRGRLQLCLGERDDRGAALLPDPRQGRIRMDRLGQDDLSRVVSGDGAGEVAPRDLAEGEAPR